MCWGWTSADEVSVGCVKERATDGEAVVAVDDRPR